MLQPRRIRHPNIELEQSNVERNRSNYKGHRPATMTIHIGTFSGTEVVDNLNDFSSERNGWFFDVGGKNLLNQVLFPFVAAFQLVVNPPYRQLVSSK